MKGLVAAQLKAYMSVAGFIYHCARERTREQLRSSCMAQMLQLALWWIDKQGIVSTEDRTAFGTIVTTLVYPDTTSEAEEECCISSFSNGRLKQQGEYRIVFPNAACL